MTTKSDHRRARAASESCAQELDVGERLAVVAGVSLGLTDDEIDTACETLFYESSRTELADLVEARVLELLKLAGKDDPEARTALQVRRGLEFFARAANTGTPAMSALRRARKILSGVER